MTWKDFVAPSLEAAKDLGLDPKETIFEELPQEEINRLAAQGVPWALPHWSRGRDALFMDAQWRSGMSQIMEIVFDMGETAIAYISTHQRPSSATLTVPHVYGHSHVYNCNAFQAKVGDLWSQYREAYRRYAEYEEKYGFENLEQWVDLALALSNLCRRDRTEYFIPEEPPGYYDPYSVTGRPQDFQDLRERRELNQLREISRREGWMESDLLRWILEHAPLEEWQRDILSTERALALYWNERSLTKILHEGFATWTHDRILRMLDLPPEWVFELAHSHARVTRTQLSNPYWLGWKTIEYIERVEGREGLLQKVRILSDHSLLFSYKDDPGWLAYIYEESEEGRFFFQDDRGDPVRVPFSLFAEELKALLEEEWLPHFLRPRLEIYVGDWAVVSSALGIDMEFEELVLDIPKDSFSRPWPLTSLQRLDPKYANRVAQMIWETTLLRPVIFQPKGND